MTSAETEQQPIYTVTCHTQECRSAGRPRLMLLSWTDPETLELAKVSAVHCGACGREITDITPPLYEPAPATEDSAMTDTPEQNTTPADPASEPADPATDAAGAPDAAEPEPIGEPEPEPAAESAGDTETTFEPAAGQPESVTEPAPEPGSVTEPDPPVAPTPPATGDESSAFGGGGIVTGRTEETPTA